MKKLAPILAISLLIGLSALLYWSYKAYSHKQDLYGIDKRTKTEIATVEPEFVPEPTDYSFYFSNTNRNKEYKGHGAIVRIKSDGSAYGADTMGITIAGTILNIKNQKPIKGAVLNVTPLFIGKKQIRTIAKARTCVKSSYATYTRKTGNKGQYYIGAPCKGLFMLEVKAAGYYTYADTLYGGSVIGKSYGMDIGLEKK